MSVPTDTKDANRHLEDGLPVSTGGEKHTVPEQCRLRRAAVVHRKMLAFCIIVSSPLICLVMTLILSPLFWPGSSPRPHPSLALQMESVDFLDMDDHPISHAWLPDETELPAPASEETLDVTDSLQILEPETTPLASFLQRRQDDSGSNSTSSSAEEEVTSSTEEEVTSSTEEEEVTSETTSIPIETTPIPPTTTEEDIPTTETSTTPEPPPPTTTIPEPTTTSSEPPTSEESTTEEPTTEESTTEPSSTIFSSATSSSTSSDDEEETTSSSGTSTLVETTSTPSSETIPSSSTVTVITITSNDETPTPSPTSQTTTEEEEDGTSTTEEQSMTSSRIIATRTEVLDNGVTTVITSTSWVDVPAPSEIDDEPVDTDLQDASSRPAILMPLTISLAAVASFMLVM